MGSLQGLDAAGALRAAKLETEGAAAPKRLNRPSAVGLAAIAVALAETGTPASEFLGSTRSLSAVRLA